MSTPAAPLRAPTPSTSARLTPLSRPVRTALRSTVVIPTIPHLLSELVHNALDAQAGKIDIWIDPSKEGQSIRVEDDGVGIPPGRGGLEGIGGRWRSSKGGNWAGGEGYGYRGEALASIAALGLLEIVTRPEGSLETYAKVIRGSKVLFDGVSTRSLGRERGTTIVVKDLFHDIPVRQASMAASSSSLLAACKKVVETLALVRPGVKWTLWEEAAVGSSVAGAGIKKVLSISGGKKSVDVFRGIYGVAGVEKVQSIRVSSGSKRIDGFISLEGSVTKSHQHLYVNNYPLDKSDLHTLISLEFSKSKFSSHTNHSPFTPGTSTRRSPRRLERHPIYVLNIQIPSSEVDASYTPGKTLMGYADEVGVQRFVLAVVDEFLRRHEFVNPAKAPEALDATTPLRTNSAPVLGHGSLVQPSTPMLARPASALSGPRTQRLGFPQSITAQQTIPATSPKAGDGPGAASGGSKPLRHMVTPLQPRNTPSGTPLPARPGSAVLPMGMSVARSLQLQSDRGPPRTGEKRKLESLVGGYRIDESGRKRYKWIDDILAEVDSGVLAFTPKSTAHGPDHACCHSHTGDHQHSSHPHSLSPLSDPPLAPLRPYITPSTVLRPTSEITFSASSLSRATILGQVDFKFIGAVIPSPTASSPDGKTLVLIDQHAADERVSIEAILQELCDGFINDSIPITELAEPLPAIILSRQEAEVLCDPGVRGVFARWGIELNTSSVEADGEGGYVQIPIQAVPTALKARLSRKEASEMTRLVKLYLAELEVGLGQVEAVIRRGEREKVDWGEVLRWMPKEMLELANSKACRNAIMFGDRLTVEQCERLVRQLGNMRFPFMCAHGRPSLVPVMQLEGAPVEGRRRIDWGKWKRDAG